MAIKRLGGVMQQVKVKCPLCYGRGFRYEYPDPEDNSREYEINCDMCFGLKTILAELAEAPLAREEEAQHAEKE